MSTFRTGAWLITATLAGLPALASAAHAQANCAVYAKLALEQQQQNLLNKCGFTGPEWNDQYSRHLAWCGTVGPDQWKQQLQMRNQKLAACKPKT